MPGRKMYGRRRRVARRGRNPRKMWRGRKGRLYSINKVYAYRRCNKTLVIQNGGTLGTITTNDSTQITLGGPAAGSIGYDFGASLTFKLDNVQNYFDFTSLYDAYKISGVKVTMIPLQDNAQGSTNSYLPVVYMATDYDDSVVPTEGEMRQKNNVKMTRLTGIRSIYIKNPKYESVVANNGGTGIATINNGWVNCADSTVLHNGLKLFFKNFDLRTTGTQNVRFEIMYYLKFKAVQ